MSVRMKPSAAMPAQVSLAMFLWWPPLGSCTKVVSAHLREIQLLQQCRAENPRARTGSAQVYLTARECRPEASLRAAVHPKHTNLMRSCRLDTVLRELFCEPAFTCAACALGGCLSQFTA